MISSVAYKSINMNDIAKYIENYIFEEKNTKVNLVLFESLPNKRMYYLYDDTNKLIGIVDAKVSNYVYFTIVGFPDKKEKYNSLLIKETKNFLNSIKYFNYDKPIVPTSF
jgi:hypothetical protein